MTVLFLSCEHGGNEVPAPVKRCFAGHEEVLQTHRGLDIGALDLFRHLAPLAEEVTFTTLSRLCIEMNRSEGHPELFSRYTRDLRPSRKAELLGTYHAYRQNFTERIRARTDAGQDVLHIAVHTFTPVLDGERRHVDIGLLYDPARAAEATFCQAWGQAIMRQAPGLEVRMNQPYEGIADAFPTALRTIFPQHYAGIELEVNQLFAGTGKMNAELSAALYRSLEETIKALP